MLQSQIFPKTRKDAPADATSINHKLLVKAGFVDQLMAGSWTLFPLGWKVATKIENIIREEINKVGGQELLMPLLHPKNIWNETGRWDSASEVMYKLKDEDKEYVLSFTHEEIVMDLLRKNIVSYKDLPVSVYHFSTKFRKELRAKSGVLRGREFLMKDLYSAHVSEESLMEHYEKVKSAYIKIFERLGLPAKVTKASGGVFTDKFSHEFQVITDAGEDTIYFKDGESEAINDEVFEGNKEDYQTAKSIEVGNIFPLGTRYAEKMNVNFTSEDGSKKPVWFGSYGIGITRVLGTLVEVHHDDKGIIWDKAVAPFDVHLISLNKNEQAQALHDELHASGIEVLFDDRDVPAGEKFGDSDLIGIPVRLVISEKTGDKIEYKLRSESETQLLEKQEVLQKLHE